MKHAQRFGDSLHRRNGSLPMAAVALRVEAAEAPRPLNLVLILTDNHSPWTLGCYGNRDIRTPNIDRLAGEGMLFERCYSSNAVCSPTRATLLTGLMPSQHGVHTYLGAGGAQVGPRAYSTIAEFRTLPEILAEAGYTCGLSGKWHLGDNLKPQEGFTYWITKPHGHTAEFYDQEVIEDGQIRKEPTYLTDLWTQHAVKFLEQNRDRPFFLYLAYNGPYGLGNLLLNPARNRHAEYYADKELPSFPREPMHPWLFNNKQFLNNPAAMRRYAAEVSGVDDGVGTVLETLKRLNLEDNTLVVFTADQGLAGGQSGLWGMGDHTRPLSAFDGTMHVPLIVRHPGVIPAGKRSQLLISNYDL
jgi:arylsulfatase A-like enzyme